LPTSYKINCLVLAYSENPTVFPLVHDSLLSLGKPTQHIITRTLCVQAYQKYSSTLLKIIFHTILTLIIFSLWAGFALLIINPYFQNDLPNYEIGTICIWEYIALVIAWAIAYLMIKSWGTLECKIIDNKSKLVLSKKYGIFILVYLTLVIAVAIWQFWIFSLKF